MHILLRMLIKLMAILPSLSLNSIQVNILFIYCSGIVFYNLCLVLKVTFHLPLLQNIGHILSSLPIILSLSYTQESVPLIPHPPYCPSLPFPLVTTSLFSTSVILLHFCFIHQTVVLVKILLISHIKQSLSFSV